MIRQVLRRVTGLSDGIGRLLCVGVAAACCLCFVACSSPDSTGTGSQKNESQETADNGSVGEYAPTNLGEKWAGSMSEYYDSLLKDDFTPTDHEKEVLDEAKSHGGVTVSQYEEAWSTYKSCMLNKGYVEIILVKFPNGVTREAPIMANNTSAQFDKYVEDEFVCNGQVNAIINAYHAQIGNPSLFANKSEAIVDCLRREGAVSNKYSVQDYVKDQEKELNNRGYDPTNPVVRGCQVANDVSSAYPDDVYENPWGPEAAVPE